MIPERLLNVENRNEVIDEIVGEAAWVLNEQWLEAKKNDQGLVFLSTLSDWTNSTLFPSYLTAERDIVQGKQQPSFVDAVKETVERLQFLECYSRGLPDSVVGQIAGGSMNYGRFYNIRGGDNPSDIDFIMVVKDDFLHSQVDIERMFSRYRGFDPEESGLFMQRMSRFASLYESGTAQIISQKFKTDGYILSLKVIPFDVFKWEFSDLLLKLVKNRQDARVAILDYKPEPYSDRVLPRKNFFRETFPFLLDEQVLSNGEVITSVPAAVFKDETLYTGDHHNHIIPRFEVYFDRDGEVTDVVNQFVSVLKTEFEQEAEIVENRGNIRFINIMDCLPLLSPQLVKYTDLRYPL